MMVGYFRGCSPTDGSEQDEREQARNAKPGGNAEL